MDDTKLHLSHVSASVAERLRREIRNLIPKGSQVRVLPLANLLLPAALALPQISIMGSVSGNA